MGSRKTYTYKGITGSLPYLCTKFRLNYNLVNSRLHLGWSLEDAIEKPKGNNKGKKYTYKGITGSLPYLCKTFGKSYHTVGARLRSGMSLEEAMENRLIERVRVYSSNLFTQCKHLNKNYSEVVDLCMRGVSENEALTTVIATFDYNDTSVRRKSADYSYYKQAIREGFKDTSEMLRYKCFTNKKGYISIEDWRNLEYVNKNKKLVREKFNSLKQRISFEDYLVYLRETQESIPISEWQAGKRVEKFYKDIAYTGSLGFEDLLREVFSNTKFSNRIYVLKRLVLDGVILEVVGSELGVSRERVRQIRNSSKIACKKYCNGVSVQYSGNGKLVKVYKYKGITGNLPYLCNKFGLNYCTVKIRLQKGWSLEDAMEKPKYIRKDKYTYKGISGSRKTYTYKGITGSLYYLCSELNVNYTLVYNRLQKGWSLEDAIEKPKGYRMNTDIKVSDL